VCKRKKTSQRYVIKKVLQVKYADLQLDAIYEAQNLIERQASGSKITNFVWISLCPDFGSKITNFAFCYDIDYHNFPLVNSNLSTHCMFGKVPNVFLISFHMSYEFHSHIHIL
jgi:hypothetical protein